MYCKDMKVKLKNFLPIGAHSLILQGITARPNMTQSIAKNRRGTEGRQSVCKIITAETLKSSPQILYVVGRLF